MTRLHSNIMHICIVFRQSKQICDMVQEVLCFQSGMIADLLAQRVRLQPCFVSVCCMWPEYGRNVSQKHMHRDPKWFCGGCIRLVFAMQCDGNFLVLLSCS